MFDYSLHVRTISLVEASRRNRIKWLRSLGTDISSPVLSLKGLPRRVPSAVPRQDMTTENGRPQDIPGKVEAFLSSPAYQSMVANFWSKAQ